MSRDSPIVVSNAFGNANSHPENLLGTEHFKNGIGDDSQRIMEFELKYTFYSASEYVH